MNEIKDKRMFLSISAGNFVGLEDGASCFSLNKMLNVGFLISFQSWAISSIGLLSCGFMGAYSQRATVYLIAMNSVYHLIQHTEYSRNIEGKSGRSKNNLAICTESNFCDGGLPHTNSNSEGDL